jgi:hypothetical protein
MALPLMAKSFVNIQPCGILLKVTRKLPKDTNRKPMKIIIFQRKPNNILWEAYAQMKLIIVTQGVTKT